jgi:hypothetical protein
LLSKNKYYMLDEKFHHQPSLITAEQPLTANAEAHENHNPSDEMYRQFLDQAALSLEEVSTNRPAIEAAGQELIDTYGIDPTFFDKPSYGLLFTSIASRWSKSKIDKGERIFLEDALTLLGHEHSPKLKAVYEYAKSDDLELSEDHKQKVYDKYTNHQMSSELKEAIDGGLFEGVKARLGITSDTEDPYEVRVLSIGDAMSTYGMHAPRLPDMNYEDFKDPEKSSQYDEARAVYDAVREWKEGLEIRREAFLQELGESSDAAPAWVTHVNGKTLLCLQQGIVEKILHPEATASSKFYNEEDLARNIAYLEHEYVHTQDGLNLDGQSIDFGIDIEELRAEDFSGNKHGYQDVKSFAVDMGVVTGTHLARYFEGKPKGGDCFSIYKEVAKTVGLERMLEVVMVRPAAYERSQANLLNAMVASHLGGFDGVITRLIEDSMQTGKSTEIDGRIDQLARRYIARTNLDFLPTFFSMRRQYGNVIMTDLLDKRVQELQQIEPNNSAFNE